MASAPRAAAAARSFSFDGAPAATYDAYKQLFACRLSTSDRSSLSRAVARVDAAQRSELSAARTTASDALLAMRHSAHEAALAQRTAAASAAKHACAIEELRAQLARASRLLEEERQRARAAEAEAEHEAARADIAAETLAIEIRRLEKGRGIMGDMLSDERRSSMFMEQEGGLLRMQSRRAGALLQEQTKQMQILRKKLAEAQRRLQKLSQLQQASHAWSIERARLREQLRAQERATEEARAAADLAEARAAQVAFEAGQEREASRAAVAHTQLSLIHI